MMKQLLVTALFGIGIFVGVCNAACFSVLPKGHIDGDPGECSFGGQTYKYGSRWRTDACQDCDCYNDGSVRCCEAFGTPVDYDKVKCEKIWNQEACAYSVVRKNNPKKTCKHAMVG